MAGDPSDQPRGADLYLTLDERLQYIAEKEIATRVQETQAKSGLVIIMHPATRRYFSAGRLSVFQSERLSRSQAACLAAEPSCD